MNKVALERSLDTRLIHDMENGYTATMLYYARNVDYMPENSRPALKRFLVAYDALLQAFSQQNQIIIAHGEPLTEDD